METQAIRINGEKADSKEALKKGAALAGAAALGAASVVSADIIRGDEQLDVVDPIEPTDDIATHDDIADVEPVVEDETATATIADEAAHEASAVEPQPQAAEEHQADSPNANQHHDQASAEIVTDDIPDVDPQIIAQDLTNDIIMVDPTDIDTANIDIASVTTGETIDGETITAAQFTGENGEALFMVDVNGDSVYDVVADSEGNVLGQVPTTLTVSDTENILGVNSGDTGYMAQNEHDHTGDLAEGVDTSMDDVVDLG